MASDLTRISVPQKQAETEFELLQVLLKDDIYPWSIEAMNPEDDYFVQVEAEWAEPLSDEDSAAIASNGQHFFAQLDQAWADADALQSQATVSVDNPLATVQATLAAQFSDRVPANLIQTLTDKAQQLAAQPLSLAEQLVQCVEDSLPEWGYEDLQVLARPYAFAMRSPETDKLEVALRSVRYAAWTELSGVEQARLSLAIARYTLSQMPSNTLVNQ